MLIFAVSLICAVMLGSVYFLAYGLLAEAIIVAFLLFVALDTGQRSLLNKRFPFSMKTRSRAPGRKGKFTGKLSATPAAKQSAPSNKSKPKKAKKTAKGKIPVKAKKAKKPAKKAKKPAKKAVKVAKKAKKPTKKPKKKAAKKQTKKSSD